MRGCEGDRIAVVVQEILQGEQKSGDHIPTCPNLIYQECDKSHVVRFHVLLEQKQGVTSSPSTWTMIIDYYGTNGNKKYIVIEFVALQLDELKSTHCCLTLAAKFFHLMSHIELRKIDVFLSIPLQSRFLSILNSALYSICPNFLASVFSPFAGAIPPPSNQSIGSNVYVCVHKMNKMGNKLMQSKCISVLTFKNGEGIYCAT